MGLVSGVGLTLSQNPGKLGKAPIQDFRAKEDNLGVKVFRSQPLSLLYFFLCAIHLASQGLAGCVGFIPIFFCETSECSVGLWGRSGIQGSRSEVSRFVFLEKVELGVPKLGHRCALKL